MVRIKFTRSVQFLGRNGNFIASGIQVSMTTGKDGAVVSLAPITGKGEVGRAYIEIPLEHWQQIDDLVKAELTNPRPVVEQHHYHPDYQCMGDCSVCGNVEDSPVHFKYPKEPNEKNTKKI